MKTKSNKIKKVKKKKTIHDLYPIIVHQSRYSGIYEGGKWFATGGIDFDEFDDRMREYLHGDDTDAVDFWYSAEANVIGVGDDPQSAVIDLLVRNDVDDTDEDAEITPTYRD